MINKTKLLCISVLSILSILGCSTSEDIIDNKMVENKDLFKITTDKDISFGNIDKANPHTEHIQNVRILNTGKFAIPIDLPKSDEQVFTISTSDNFKNPLKPNHSYDYQIKYKPIANIYGHKEMFLNMNKYITIPKYNEYVNGNGIIYSSDIQKTTFIDTYSMKEFDGMVKVNAKYSELTFPEIVYEAGNIIDFGNIYQQGDIIKEVRLKNIGDGNAIISNIQLDDSNGIFKLIMPENFKTTFKPNDIGSFQILANTNNVVGGVLAKIIVTSNSVNSPYEIMIAAQGRQPNVDISGGDTTLPDGEGETDGSFNPSTNIIDFGLTSVGKLRTFEMRLTNKNKLPLIISELKIEGADITLGEGSKKLPIVINTGNTHTIEIKFQPKLARKYIANITATAKLDSQEFNLNYGVIGEGIAPVIQLSNKNVMFDRVDLGKDKTQTITITNIGKQVLNINSLKTNTNNVSEDEAHLKNAFDIINENCSGNPISYKQKCEIELKYAPKVYGEVLGKLSIESNNHTEKVTEVNLSGIGSGSLLIMENNIDFGSIDTKKEHNLEILYKGGNKVTFESAKFLLNKNYKIIENNCSVLNNEEKCNIKIEFTPTSDGKTLKDVLEIVYNDITEKKYNVSFIGSGLRPILKSSLLNNEVLNFGNVAVNNEGFKRITFTNVGTKDLTINNLKISGDYNHIEYYIHNNECDKPIKPNGSCNIDIKVIPLHTGTIIDTLKYTTNEPENNNYVINLSTTSINADISVSKNEIDFGNKYIYPEMEYTQDVTVTNIGTEPLNLYEIKMLDEKYILNNTCNKKLAPREQCNIQVKITPNKQGEIVDILRIKSSSTVNPVKEIKVKLQGMNRSLSVSSDEIDFGEVFHNASLESKTLTISNTGNMPLTFNNILITSPFIIKSNTCKGTINPNSTCNININIKHPIPSVQTGILTIASDSIKESHKSISLKAIIKESVYMLYDGKDVVEVLGGTYTVKYNDYYVDDNHAGGGADVSCADEAIISDGIKSYEMNINNKPSITIGVYSNAKITLQKIGSCSCTPNDPGQQACDYFRDRFISIHKQG